MKDGHGVWWPNDIDGDCTEGTRVNHSLFETHHSPVQVQNIPELAQHAQHEVDAVKLESLVPFEDFRHALFGLFEDGGKRFKELSFEDQDKVVDYLTGPQDPLAIFKEYDTDGLKMALESMPGADTRPAPICMP